MAKLRNVIHNNIVVGYSFWCPGCEYYHWFQTELAEGLPKLKWNFNGDMQNPTFSPSLIVNGHGKGIRCHLFLQNGQLKFLSDCHHKLANKTVPLIDDD